MDAGVVLVQESGQRRIRGNSQITHHAFRITLITSATPIRSQISSGARTIRSFCPSALTAGSVGPKSAIVDRRARPVRHS